MECRICFEGQEEQGQGRLFSPCLCAGSQRYIHEKCLDNWRQQGGGAAFIQCPTCHYKYRIARVDVAKFLLNPWFVTSISAVAIVSCVAVVAYLIQWICILLFGMRMIGTVQRTFALSGQFVWWAVLVIGILTIITSMFDEHDGNNANGYWIADTINLASDVSLQNGVVMNVFGYTICLGGFALFCYKTYAFVHKLCRGVLKKAGDYVMDIGQ